MKDPARTWNAVVVGEGTRCWFGNQFSLIALRFEAYGVELWIPELGGVYDPRNPSHMMLMSVLGGMSESERQHVQARVRAAMDVQVILRASRAAGGLEGRRKLERGLGPAKHTYVLRGRVRCGYCSRKMEGTPKHGRGYYRCVTRRLAPGSQALAAHPRNVYLPERSVLPALNAWIGELFNRDNIDQTVAALLASQDGSHAPAGAEGVEVDRDAVKRRLADAETRLSHLRAAIEAGADPAALIESLNAAQEQRAAAQAELRVLKPDPTRLTDAEVYAMIDALGDVGAALNWANPERMRKIYDSLRLEIVYDHDERAVDVSVKPLGGLWVCPRGDSNTCSSHPCDKQGFMWMTIASGRERE